MPVGGVSESRALAAHRRDIRILSLQKIVGERDENCQGRLLEHGRSLSIEMAQDDFYLTAEQREMRDLARAIARDRIAPLAAHVDEAEAYPDEALKLLGDQGLMGLYIPEAYGGTDMGTLAFCLAVEEIAWACASSATIYLVQYAGGWPIVAAGTVPAACMLTMASISRAASGEAAAAGAGGRSSDAFASTQVRHAPAPDSASTAEGAEGASLHVASVTTHAPSAKARCTA